MDFYCTHIKPHALDIFELVIAFTLASWQRHARVNSIHVDQYKTQHNVASDQGLWRLSQPPTWSYYNLGQVR